MPGPDCFFWLIVPPSTPGLWAYVGLGPGQEFIPQFLALLGLAATALLAVVQWPLRVLWSRLARAAAAHKKSQTTPASMADAPERPGEDHSHQP